MPVIFQKFINREDCQANPSLFYVFGDNTERYGLGGQAGAMRGEPNSFGVATKWTPTNDDAAFFSDEDFKTIIEILKNDLELIEVQLSKGSIVVIPLDGLGSGLSKLPEYAPNVDEWLQQRIADFVEKYNTETQPDYVSVDDDDDSEYVAQKGEN